MPPTIRSLPISSTATDPRTGGPLQRAGVRACVLTAGAEWHQALSSLARDRRIVSVGLKLAQVTDLRLSYIDRLSAADFLAQAEPSWRTPEGAEAGLIAEYGDKFGRMVTVVHFEVLP
jgi:hypothetical protein